jgi:hypothetical protein
MHAAMQAKRQSTQTSCSSCQAVEAALFQLTAGHITSTCWSAALLGTSLDNSKLHLNRTVLLLMFTEIKYHLKPA